MSAREGLAFFNVTATGITETTLEREAIERLPPHPVGRGRCVAAFDARQARRIVDDYHLQIRGRPPSVRGPVVLMIRYGIPVLRREVV